MLSSAKFISYFINKIANRKLYPCFDHLLKYPLFGNLFLVPLLLMTFCIWYNEAKILQLLRTLSKLDTGWFNYNNIAGCEPQTKPRIYHVSNVAERMLRGLGPKLIRLSLYFYHRRKGLGNRDSSFGIPINHQVTPYRGKSQESRRSPQWNQMKRGLDGESL